MSFFSKILNKLGIGKKDDAPEFAGMAKPAGVVKGSMPAKPAAAPPQYRKLKWERMTR